MRSTRRCAIRAFAIVSALGTAGCGGRETSTASATGPSSDAATSDANDGQAKVDGGLDPASIACAKGPPPSAGPPDYGCGCSFNGCLRTNQPHGFDCPTDHPIQVLCGDQAKPIAGVIMPCVSMATTVQNDC